MGVVFHPDASYRLWPLVTAAAEPLPLRFEAAAVPGLGRGGALLLLCLHDLHLG
jgi:hypothetical protein